MMEKWAKLQHSVVYLVHCSIVYNFFKGAVQGTIQSFIYRVLVRVKFYAAIKKNKEAFYIHYFRRISKIIICEKK